MPLRGRRKSVAVSLKQFTGFCAPAPSVVNCQPTLASGTTLSSATRAGKRTVSGPTCSNFSPKTQTWQRSCPTVQLDAPVCAQQAVPKNGAPARQGLGRSRGGFSGKIHLLADELRFPLQFILTGCERHDLSQAESLLAPFHFDAAIADKDYSSDLLGELVTARQVEVFIPSSRLSQATARDNGRLRYRKRNIAGRFINRAKWFRRIFTRNEKLPRRFMAFLHISASLMWL